MALAQDYIAGRVELAALDTWLAEHAQEIARAEASDPLARLAGVIGVTMAEMDAGHATVGDVRSRIEGFLMAQSQARSSVGRVAS